MKTTVLLIHFALALRAHSEGGIPLWSNRFNGAGNAYDIAFGIVADRNGNVFVTGSSFLIDAKSNNWVTVAYSNGGAPLWTNVYDGPSHNLDQPRAIAVGINGNVVVTGYSFSSTNNPSDYATVAYSNTGVPLWTNLYNGPANTFDYPATLAVDSSGNVFVTGYSDGNGTDNDFATIKYSDTGVPLWTNRYNGPGNGVDSSLALVVDGNGNAIVTGISLGNGTGFDYATIKYSSAGVPLWTNRYAGPGDDYAVGISVDKSGNVVVTGHSASLGSEPDYLTISYSPGGIPLWTNRYNGTGNGSDGANSVIINDNGDIFVTGASIGAGPGYDCATLAYSSMGVPLWTNRYNSPENGYDGGGFLALDKDRNVFVLGSIGTEYLTLAYSIAGTPLWTNRFVNGNGDFGPSGIATDSEGNVFVTGAAADEAFGNSSDYITIKYSSSLRPRLLAQKLNNGIVLTWPTNAGAFTLQSATNLNPPILWSDSTDTPSRVGNQFSVTNSASIGEQFFRLK